MGPYALPPETLGVEWTPMDPIEIPGGPDVVLGRVPVPFGGDADRGAVRRMADAEQELVTRGVPVGSAALGVGARLEAGEVWALDGAVVAAGTRSVEKMARRGAVAPDLALRAAYAPAAYEVGVSVWLGELWGVDHALGVDTAVDVGRWRFGVELAHQRIGDVKAEFGDEVKARELLGERAGVRIERRVRPHWSFASIVESQVFRTRLDVALPPWVRGAVGLSYEVRRRVRWTLVEVADVVTLGPSPDCQRVSTRLELARGG